MQFNRYENFVESMWIRSDTLELDTMHALAGLAAEVGEVNGVFQKHLRKVANGTAEQDAPDEQKVVDELGDVLFYLTRLAHICGYSLDTVVNRNMEKLQNRKIKGEIAR